MKRLLVAALLLTSLPLWTQDVVVQVRVKSTEINNGVVIITAERIAADQPATRSTFELRCNKGLSECEVPSPGVYAMVELPRNRGMYDCMNADLYPMAGDPDTSKRIGEYCISKE